MPQSRAMLSLVAAMAMTGANVPIGKVILASMPVEALLGLRFMLASAVLAMLVQVEPGRRLIELSPKRWLAVVALGIVGSLLFTLLLLEGVRRTSAADAGIILAALPAVVAVIGIVGGERPGQSQLAMIGLAVLGVALIQGAAEGGTRSLLGNLLVVLAVLCEATFVLASRGISRELGPLRLSLAVSLVSLVVAVPIAWQSLARLHWASVPATTWALIGWYTVSSSILCTALWYRGVAHVPAWRSGLATAAVPVAALALSVAMLGETIGAARLAGAVLVIAAICAGARRVD